jgi:hypothetical protein
VRDLLGKYCFIPQAIFISLAFPSFAARELGSSRQVDSVDFLVVSCALQLLVSSSQASLIALCSDA